MNFHGHGIFLWDANDACHACYWFDSMGMPPTTYRAVFDFSEGGHYVFKMEISQDGAQWNTFMEGRYERQAGRS